jgi:hypothetical protein
MECVSIGQEFKVVIRAYRRLVNEHRGQHNALLISEFSLVIMGLDKKKRNIILQSIDLFFATFKRKLMQHMHLRNVS